MSARYADLKGRALFRQWLQNRGFKRSDIAELLAIPPAQIGAWCSGLSRPSYPDREALRFLANILPEDWLTPAEAEARKNKLARVDRLAKTDVQAPNVFERLAARR
jgi:transcriptional regulator with XRE-family HTH domain